MLRNCIPVSVLDDLQGWFGSSSSLAGHKSPAKFLQIRLNAFCGRINNPIPGDRHVAGSENPCATGVSRKQKEHVLRVEIGHHQQEHNVYLQIRPAQQLSQMRGLNPWNVSRNRRTAPGFASDGLCKTAPLQSFSLECNNTNPQKNLRLIDGHVPCAMCHVPCAMCLVQ